MKEMIRMMVVLSLICGLSGVTLAALKQATAPIIEEQVLTFVQAPAIGSVLSGYDNNPIRDRKTFEVDGAPVTVFPAIRDGQLVGVALETSGRGYGGNIGVMVGFDMENDTLLGIGITTMKETPGLGTRVADHGFTSQFRGRAAGAIGLKKDGGDVEAVAGATISSGGTVAAVRQAVAIFTALKPGLADAWS